MSKKLYWSEEIDDEMSYTRKSMLEEMKERGIDELKVYISKPEKIDGYFFCRKLWEWSESNDSTCGKRNCEFYSPRNGKNGRCRFHDIWSYESTNEFIILKVNPCNTPAS